MGATLVLGVLVFSISAGELVISACLRSLFKAFACFCMLSKNNASVAGTAFYNAYNGNVVLSVCAYWPKLGSPCAAAVDAVIFVRFLWKKCVVPCIMVMHFIH